MTPQVLIVGAGGREHALARRLAASASHPRLWAAPGNPGLLQFATQVPVDPADQRALASWCRGAAIDLVVIGPEDPLIAGLADVLRDAGLEVFGPGAEGARLEGDKEHAKQIMAAAGVPTAGYVACGSLGEALDRLAEAAFPLVVKACGAAQGKGVAVCADRAAARAHLELCFTAGAFGAAGERVLLEECLTGPELSILAVTDGRDYGLLCPSRDHKRLGEGDTGPNTGGMGVVASAELLTPALGRAVADGVVAPVLAELRRRGVDYRGVLYVGLMLTPDGPRVLEFNCRFGDPETQAVLPLLRVDLLDLLRATARGGLGAWLEALPAPGPGAPPDWPGAALTDWERAAAVVVAAAHGYPGTVRRG
ncbi:MAG: phosphoribosylamine--glycine ligase, partial [Candidatus Latescibacteria bacterium]|nr:phosphoribosylamine--glycine ligase [Candidatus Latescibacterota bacterium]